VREGRKHRRAEDKPSGYGTLQSGQVGKIECAFAGDPDIRFQNLKGVHSLVGIVLFEMTLGPEFNVGHVVKFRMVRA
jgi:hypothetical protein